MCNFIENNNWVKLLSFWNKRLVTNVPIIFNNEALSNKTRYEQIYSQVNTANETIVEYLGVDEYTAENLNGIETDDAAVTQSVAMIQNMYNNGDISWIPLWQRGRWQRSVTDLPTQQGSWGLLPV